MFVFHVFDRIGILGLHVFCIFFSGAQVKFNLFRLTTVMHCL